MAVNFPDAPTNNQSFVGNGITYIWNGSAWIAQGAASGIPEAPTDGQLYGRESAAWAVVPPSPAASSTTPIMDGTANVGTGTTWARADHVHPSDTSRYAATNPAGYQTAGQVSAALGPYALTSAVPVASSTLPIMDGSAAIGSGTTWAKADHIHPSDTSRYAASNPSGYQTAAQVTTALAPYAPLNNPVFTGTVTLPADPASALQAATKQYVDAHGAAPGSAIVFIGDTPPASPTVGGLWWDSVGGQMYVFFNDGNSSQWVAASNSGGGVAGVTDGSSAAPGMVGEIIAVYPTTTLQFPVNTVTAVAQITLTPGDWDVNGAALVQNSSGAVITYGWIFLNNTVAYPPNTGSPFSSRHYWNNPVPSPTITMNQGAWIGPTQVNITVATTIYLLVNVQVASGTTATAVGTLRARRMR
jgi:hypothetical protein